MHWVFATLYTLSQKFRHSLWYDCLYRGTRRMTQESHHTHHTHNTHNTHNTHMTQESHINADTHQHCKTQTLDLCAKLTCAQHTVNHRFVIRRQIRRFVYIYTHTFTNRGTHQMTHESHTHADTHQNDFFLQALLSKPRCSTCWVCVFFAAACEHACLYIHTYVYVHMRMCTCIYI